MSFELLSAMHGRTTYKPTREEVLAFHPDISVAPTHVCFTLESGR
jgi:hypothetical protein